MSIYAASKKSNELMAHAYSPFIFITSNGIKIFYCIWIWGRPDMSYFLFTKSILEEKAIDVFNYGNMKRDFTYIDDIIESLIRVMEKYLRQIIFLTGKILIYLQVGLRIEFLILGIQTQCNLRFY